MDRGYWRARYDPQKVHHWRRRDDNADPYPDQEHSQVITTEPTVDVVAKEIRTFVFNIYTAVVAVVANYRITLTNALSVVRLTACYSVFPYRTKVKRRVSERWNDVCRLDHDV